MMAGSLSSPVSVAKLGVLDLLEHPVWVFDIEQRSMWWANSSAVKLWDAESRQALLSRSFEDMSESSRLRLGDYHRRFEKGEKVIERWTFFPRGQCVTVKCMCTGVDIEGGRRAMLVEGKAVVNEDIDRVALRCVEMLRHQHISVGIFDTRSGALREQNPEGLRLFGPTDSNDFVSRFEDREHGRRVLDELASKPSSFEARLVTLQGPRWFAVDARREYDPMTGEPVILASARDVTKRKAFESRLEEAKETAEAANRAKSTFFAVVTHEIRTPLNGVIGFAELLSESPGLSSEQFGFVNALRGSALSLMSIINDLLDFSKLEAGRMALELVDFELESVVASALAVVEPGANAKGLTVVHKASNVGRVVSDPNRLRQALLNILWNAVKFTDAGSISLKVQDLCQVVRFEITDTGNGIPPEKIDGLFNQHFADGETRIGLAISKVLVEAMSGSIGVASTVGHGSTIWFELPLRRAEDIRAEDIRACASRRLSVLVAEDNAVNQELATCFLARLGHVADVVDTGLKALNAAKTKRYDVALMDLHMPEMDGIEATKRIRKEKGLSANDFPIIGLTADYRPDDLSLYVDAGMNTCLGKPVRINDLRSALASLAISRPSSSSSSACSSSEDSVCGDVDATLCDTTRAG